MYAVNWLCTLAICSKNVTADYLKLQMSIGIKKQIKYV